MLCVRAVSRCFELLYLPVLSHPPPLSLLPVPLTAELPRRSPGSVRGLDGAGGDSEEWRRLCVDPNVDVANVQSQIKVGQRRRRKKKPLLQPMPDEPLAFISATLPC